MRGHDEQTSRMFSHLSPEQWLRRTIRCAPDPVIGWARTAGLLSDEHSTVGGTLVERLGRTQELPREEAAPAALTSVAVSGRGGSAPTRTGDVP